MFELKKFEELYLEPSKNGISRSSSINNIGVKIVNMGELFWYPRMKNPEMRKVITTDKENKSFGLKVGDLLFARRSLVAEGAGKCNIMLEVVPPIVFESSIIRVRLDKSLANPLFYYYYFTSDIGFAAIQTLVNEVAASGIRSSELAKLKVIYPKVTLQNRIAEILNNYDELIEVNNQRIKLLEETARELYKEWFVRMRFPGFKEAKFIKGVPEGWEIKEIKDFGKIFTGKTPSTKVMEYYGGEIPFIKTPDLHKNQFIFETEDYLTERGNNSQKRSTLPKGSICVSCIGTGGIVGITTAEKSQTNQQINSLIPKNKKLLEFLFYAISDLKETIELFGYTGATMTNLSKGKFEKLKILFALPELIELYSNKVSPMFEQIQIFQQQNTQLRQIRDRLMPRLISGKLEVKDIEVLNK
ncbi:MAG: restriction endonuclease subunit S [Bacteroidales bacterium]|nr:restriction endonuclease subunit S [Bacteroidales bacterium]